MPTYEYSCDACKHGFEIEQRITADFLRVCPKCKKPKLTRLVGTGNFILKGSGWYSDLYSGSGNKPSESSSAESASTSEAKSDSASAPAVQAAPPSATSAETKSSKREKSETATKPVVAKAPSKTSSAKTTT
jgi:putative FmdB family regulatory protein